MSTVACNASFDHTLNQINHYQRKLEKYAAGGETEKLICCIHKLKYLPVTVSHLERTGVGKSINALRHENGVIGEKARALVHKWKVMVSEEEENEEYPPVEEPKPPVKFQPAVAKNSVAKSSVAKNSVARIDPAEEYDQPSEDEDQLHIKEVPEEDAADVASYNPGGVSYHDNEEESCNGYDPRTSREDYLAIGVDSAQASYHPSSRDDEQSDEGSPGRPLPNGDIHSSDSRGEKVNKSKEEVRHKKKKHKSRHEHEGSGSSSSHKKSKHKSAKSKDKERESSKSKHKKHSSHKEHHSPHSKPKEPSQEKLPSASYSSPVYSSPVCPNSSNASPEPSQPSNSTSKKRHREHDDKQPQVSSKKSKEHSDHKAKDSSSSNNKHKEKRSHKSSKSSTKEEEHSSKKHKRKEDKNAESTSGFEAALLGMDTSPRKKKKKKKSKEKDKTEPELQNPSFDKPSNSKAPAMALDKGYLPPLGALSDDGGDMTRQLMTHYKPLPHVPQRVVSRDPFPNQMTDEEALNFMLKSKNNKQRRIYTGKVSTLSSVPTLFDSCIRVLQENIDALEATGGIPFSILRPVLEKANPQQLFTLEDYNPYLLEDTDVLWSSHCRRLFKHKKREDMETWREMFVRCTDEKDHRLNCVTESLQKKYVTKAPPKRTTQLAYVNVAAKPPRSVALAQARFGTASTSSAAQVKPVRTDETQKAGGSNNPVPRPDRPFPNKPTAVKKPKVAPLMRNARQLMKSVCRRK